MGNFIGLVFILTLIYGWFANIYYLVTVEAASTGMYIAGGFGIPFAPLGSIMGLFVW